ncbi:hypothetical protein PGT21_006342 [Puccinia graminis f. sp. tritici]|uniref:Uncharacterized protein n=1 Tax=Puccinia graminis f. sp. tritici TaxID=56615 RepID=A0A5B0MIG7_PUCGR|nr:hypothetical protein PGT21_006342 [Puccinia graminis f. sp. tritici]KAA1135547.1 hypothetical protein PGTUg99_016841 [Puccinia graminis f. sp. tritici]
MKITYLSGCLMLIVTILGSGNVSGMESCVKSLAYAPAKCANRDCTNTVQNGQYTYRCSALDCSNSDCGKKWKSYGEMCSSCQAKSAAASSQK